MKYVLIAFVGLIIFNIVFILLRLRKANRKEIRSTLEHPNRLNIRG